VKGEKATVKGEKGIQHFDRLSVTKEEVRIKNKEIRSLSVT
jgi:hypothetical protein